MPFERYPALIWNSPRCRVVWLVFYIADSACVPDPDGGCAELRPKLWQLLLQRVQPGSWGEPEYYPVSLRLLLIAHHRGHQGDRLPSHVCRGWGYV